MGNGSAWKGHALRFGAFFVVWVGLVGTHQWVELVAGACAAAITALAVALVLRLRVPSPFHAARSWKELGRSAARLAPEAGLVALAVVQRRRGRFVVVPLAPGPDWRRSLERGIAAYSASLAPNTVVVDVDQKHGGALCHELVARRQEPIA